METIETRDKIEKYKSTHTMLNENYLLSPLANIAGVRDAGSTDCASVGVSMTTI